jgi:hypothetical protein
VTTVLIRRAAAPLTALIVAGALVATSPPLCTVQVKTLLCWVTSMSSNAVAVASPTRRAGLWPVPLSEALAAPPVVALTFSCAARPPATLGRMMTVMVHVPAAGSAAVQVFALMRKSAAAVPLTAAVGTVVEVFPADDTQRDHAVSVELRDAGFVLPRVPIAVGALGFCATPSVGDLVLVVFLDGDPNAPVMVGRLYHPGLDPPAHAEGQLVLALPPGDARPALHLAASGRDATLVLTIAGDQEMVLACGREKAELRVGEMRVTVDGAGGGRTEVRAGSATVTIKKDGDVSISTGGNLKIEADQVEISGRSKVTITGAQVEIN